MRNVEPYGLSIPPCRAIPFTIEPIACSRMPNGMLRPACVAEKTPPPLNSVFVDSTRSAAPPIIVGVKCLNASIVLAPASRVATSSPAGKSGSASTQPGRGLPCAPGPSPRAAPGYFAAHASTFAFHACSSSAPRAVPFMCSRTSSRDDEVSSGFQPSATFVARTSSSPSGAPCDFAVSTAWGAP